MKITRSFVVSVLHKWCKNIIVALLCNRSNYRLRAIHESGFNVDDDEFQVVSLVDIFNNKGSKLKAHINEKEGLKKIEEVDYACVISDIRMPEMNGVEFC